SVHQRGRICKSAPGPDAAGGVLSRPELSPAEAHRSTSRRSDEPVAESGLSKGRGRAGTTRVGFPGAAAVERKRVRRAGRGDPELGVSGARGSGGGFSPAGGRAGRTASRQRPEFCLVGPWPPYSFAPALG